MNLNSEIAAGKQVYYRLIALWVLCEGFLGGIIHGLKLPVSGIIVGGGAIVCICFIAYYVPVKGAIIKATIIVAIFKMMLSPHSPPAAYFAVFFQGLAGQLILSKKAFRTTCIVFAIVAMTESALQRVFVLIIIYGQNFWLAVDEFISKVSGSTQVTNYSLMVASAYVVMHVLAGFLIGIFTSRVILSSKHWKASLSLPTNALDIVELNKPTMFKKHLPILRLMFFVAWVFLIIMFLSSYIGGGLNILPAHQSLQILLRSVLIVLTWYFMLSPVILFFMKRWLTRQKDVRHNDIQQVFLLLPFTKALVVQSWQAAEGQPRFKRIKNTLKTVLVHSVQPTNA